MSTEVSVTVLLFARLRELAGVAELPLKVSSTSSRETLIVALEAACPAASGLAEALGAPNVRLAHNEALVTDGLPVLATGDRIAFLPPVTGG